MNASELNRQLLFYGYSEATDFLKNSPLNRYLYKQFLNILPKYGIGIPMVQLFNEIYYQCVRVNYDGTPGVDIKQRYFEEESEWLKSEAAANLVFVIVWDLLKAKRKLTFHEDCFLSQMTPYIEDCELIEIGRTIYTELRYLEIEIPDPFPTLTCPISSIPKFEYIPRENRHRSLTDMINASVESKLNLGNQFFEMNEHTEAWRTVTSNYSLSIIEKYIRLYSNPDDQLELIDRLRRTLPHDDNISLEEFIMKLANSIKTGNFDPDDSSAGREDGNRQESYEISRAEDIDMVGDLKKERDELKSQIDELQKSHKMELAKMEAQYKAEIDKIGKERNRLAHEPEAREEQDSAPKPKELTLTLSEIVDFVKERFSRSGAAEMCTMLYGKAIEHNRVDEDVFKLIEGIVPAIIKRDKPQTNVDIKEASQVNINPQEVINHYTKGEG